MRERDESGALSGPPASLVRVFPFLSWIGGVTRRTLHGDLVAGITGAVRRTCRSPRWRASCCWSPRT
jgi:hypothetical protein